MVVDGCDGSVTDVTVTLALGLGQAPSRLSLLGFDLIPLIHHRMIGIFKHLKQGFILIWAQPFASLTWS